MILAKGLQANTTLQDIRLARMYDSAEELLNLTEVMTALTGHPKLRRMELVTCIIHDETCRALERLLSSPNCKIDSLQLVDIEWETNGEPFFRGLKQCKSLERMNMSFTSHVCRVQFESAGMVNLLDAVLPNCPRLESINLQNNNISSLTKLNSLVPMGQSSKIREFVIDGNPVWKNAADGDRDALLHFVRSNPELARLAGRFDFAKSDLYTPLIEHYLDLNWSGSILLSGNVSRPGIPLSVWPVVLERANRLFQENGGRQANVLYHLLDGPAFRARDYFLNFEKRQRREDA
jgi:Leucine-rich repeat (LRR) protein